MNSESLSCFDLPKTALWKDAFLENQIERCNGTFRQKNKSNYVGIVNLRGITHTYTDKKLFREESLSRGNCILFDLYNFVSKDIIEQQTILDVFEFDSENPILLKGGVFDTLLPPMFMQELSKILEYGLLKTYVLKEDNLSFARGKIDIKGQIKNSFQRSPKIACTYWDLTTDDFFNQAILRAATLLITQPNLNNAIKSRLSVYANKIRQELVEDKYISPKDFQKYKYIPQRYVNIIRLSEAVIKRKYHSISVKDEVSCPSFMINVAVIWESFLRAAIKQEFGRKGWAISKTNMSLKILSPSPSSTPDIIMARNEREVILDPKYKLQKNSGDIYQMCAYLGSKFDDKRKKLQGFLLYFGTEDSCDKHWKFYPRTISQLNEFVPLDILFCDQYLDYENFNIDRFCKKIGDLISEMLI